jgi:transposase
VVNELEHFHSAQARRLVQKVLKSLQTQIEQANQKLKALIAKEAPRAQHVQRLCSIKGVGFQTALSVSCLLPEIGSISTKQRAALVGVAPFVCDSALRCAKRSIRGGRAKLRSQLYRAALVGSRFNLILRDVYPRLIQRGKPKKVALVALMRKLLIAMHYVLKKPSLVLS